MGRAQAVPPGRASACGSARARCTSACSGGSSATATAGIPSDARRDEDVARLASALAEAGRDPGAFELVGGVRGRFPDARSAADLDEALATIPAQVERGFTSICIKPSQFLDDPARHGAWCRDVVAKVASLTA